MQKLKSQVAKVSTVRVEKTFALVIQHSQRKCESPLLSSPNWLVVIERAHSFILVLHSSKLRFIESECDLKMNALFITDATVDTFATCDFNFRMQKYALCGPRLTR